MARILVTRMTAVLTDGSADVPWRSDPTSQTILLTGSNDLRHRQTLSTSAERIILGEVGMGGPWMFRNLSTTAGEHIHLRDGAAGANVVTVNQGEEAGPVRLATGIGDLHAIAALGTPTLEYWALDP